MKTPFVIDVQQKATLKMQSVTDWVGSQKRY